MSRLKTTFITVYVILLIFSVLFVNKIISEDSLRIKDLPKDSEKVEPKEIKATLIIESGQNALYSYKGLEPYTFLNLLNDLHNKYELFYEVTYYTYGIKVDAVNNIIAPSGYEWKIYYNGAIVNESIDKYELKNDANYVLKLTRI